MASITIGPAVRPVSNPVGRLRRAIADSWYILRTNVFHFLSQPGEIIGMVAFPIIFIVLFGYVFGSAIQIPGVANYREYLMPGIFGQIAVFTMAAAAVGMTELKEKGQMDRFRSLPMARSAVLVGQTFYQLLNALVSIVVMSLCALVTGWRIHTDLPHALAGYGLLALFALAVNFVGTFVGLVVSSAKMADQVMMAVTMPLSFLANTFVGLNGLPGWLQPIATWNPLTAVVTALRQLFGNAPTLTPANQSWPLEHAMLASVIWSVGIIAVALPVSIWKYRSQE
jgi:ABC transporter DrrB family efflux protein